MISTKKSATVNPPPPPYYPPLPLSLPPRGGGAGERGHYRGGKGGFWKRLKVHPARRRRPLSFCLRVILAETRPVFFPTPGCSMQALAESLSFTTWRSTKFPPSVLQRKLKK